MPLVLVPEIGELAIRPVHSLDIAGLAGAGRKLYQFSGSLFYRPARIPGRFPNAIAVMLFLVWHDVTCLTPDRHPRSGDFALFDGSRDALVEESVNPILVRLVWRPAYGICLGQFEPE